MRDAKSADSEPANAGRRGFLAGAIATMASFIAGAIAIPSIGHIISPALKIQERPRISLGRVDQFEVGKPKKIDFVYFKRDGWIEEQASGSAWVVRGSATTLTVFDPRCTHLGCPYGWSADRGQFICPCHDAAFAIDGRVISGPPPRGLDRFESAVEGGSLFVREVVTGA